MKVENKIIFWASIGHFCNHIGNYLTPALLIYLQTDIPLTQTERGLLGSIPMILLVLLSSLVGWLGDRYPKWKKHMIWFGILGIGFFGILMSYANSFFDLAIATVVLGFALSTYHPLAFTFINTMDNKDRNMGINAVSGNFGSAITPFIAMIFAIFWGWRMAFLGFSLFQILIGFSFAVIFPNDQKTHSSLNDYTQKEHKDEVPFTESNFFILSILLVLISAARAPVFRCISYFTTVVFKDAFLFTNIESSILSALILGVGAFATFLMGTINNRKAIKGVGRDERVNFRINSILLSNGAAALLLILLVILPMSSTLPILFVYIFLSFFFFLGAAILPTILSEVTGPSHGMASSMGLLFTGATLTGAVAPTVFGFLADELGFEASFLFLGSVALLCLILIILFKFVYRAITKRNDINHSLAE
ncbi:MAG: MFS transporter [Candidatus Heimdallarchaeota archaeon]|nr:MAG: MFS transporter [Candidatus Heimdallarchaeota archaeon]